jgi:hypothetical protein
LVVDAPSSAALARHAEAKGAVKLSLSQAYAKRNHVALIAFRGDQAEVLLPPTRSLVQTKRMPSGTPGGGGTPLAAESKKVLELPELSRNKGLTPSIAFLTDGRANLDLSGAAYRTTAAGDATLMARAIRMQWATVRVVDMGHRPPLSLFDLAAQMGLPCLPLPRADPPRPVRSGGNSPRHRFDRPLPPSDWPNADISQIVPCAPHRWHPQIKGNGLEMLLRHGAGVSTHLWQYLVALLADRYRLIAVDVPEHGFPRRGVHGRSRLPDGVTDRAGERKRPQEHRTDGRAVVGFGPCPLHPPDRTPPMSTVRLP